MAITEVNLGSTFKDFLEALNNASENTNGIIEGSKKIKRLKIGDEENTNTLEETTIQDDLNDSLFLTQKATNYALLTGLNGETGFLSNAAKFHAFSKNGKVSLEGSLYALLKSTNSNGENSYVKCQDGNINFWADNISTFYGNVDFSEATVTGLSIPDIDTSNLVTLDDEQIISGKKIFENFE